MSLATRCPACATVFRVVQDQLRVSEGWVRCGRCGEVFNAAEALVNLDGAAPAPAAPPPPPPTPRPPPPPRPGPGPATSTNEPLAFIDPEPEFEETRPVMDGRPPSALLGANALPGQEFVVSDEEPMTPPPRWDLPDTLPERTDIAAAGAPDPAPNEPVEQALRSAPPAAAQASRSLDLPRDPVLASDYVDSAPMAPSFIQSADRAARWQQPGVRRTLLLLATVGVIVLALQAAIEFRAQAGARWPVLRPLLAQLCNAFGCRVEPLRQIESLSVESSGLVRIENTPQYRLSVVLRNKAAIDLAPPSLDLSLTDAQGKVIARRVLSLGELGIHAKAMVAGTELPVQAAVGVGERPVVGYTVEIFYP